MTLNASREILVDPSDNQRTWRKQGKEAWSIPKHSHPKTEVGTCVWKLLFGSDLQKETQKGGKGWCSNSQTSCELPKHSPHQPQVSQTGDAWANISMHEGTLSSLRHNPLVNFRNMNIHQSPSLSATREHLVQPELVWKQNMRPGQDVPVTPDVHRTREGPNNT